MYGPNTVPIEGSEPGGADPDDGQDSAAARISALWAKISTIWSAACSTVSAVSTTRSPPVSDGVDVELGMPSPALLFRLAPLAAPNWERGQVVTLAIETAQPLSEDWRAVPPWELAF